MSNNQVEGAVINVPVLGERVPVKLQIEDYEDMLVANSEGVSEEQIKQDTQELIRITKGIAYDSGRWVCAIGKKLHEGRELLKKYKQRVFGQWVESTAVGSRMTAYNMIYYYELWAQLKEEDLQNKFKSLPLSYAYRLAARPGDIETKKRFLSTGDFNNKSGFLNELHNMLGQESHPHEQEEENREIEIAEKFRYGMKTLSLGLYPLKQLQEKYGNNWATEHQKQEIENLIRQLRILI